MGQDSGCLDNRVRHVSSHCCHFVGTELLQQTRLLMGAGCCPWHHADHSMAACTFAPCMQGPRPCASAASLNLRPLLLSVTTNQAPFVNPHKSATTTMAHKQPPFGPHIRHLLNAADEQSDQEPQEAFRTHRKASGKTSLSLSYAPRTAAAAPMCASWSRPCSRASSESA